MTPVPPTWLPAPTLHAGAGCICPLHARRLFTGLLAGSALGAPAWAQQEGVRNDVGRTSRLAKLVPAEEVEGAAAEQYLTMMKQAGSQRALAGPEHPQVIRLRAIAKRIIPFAPPWNSRAQQWRWEVNLLMTKELNAFCMPGGKIAFYYGILQQLQLSDDEVATIMGHEVAHALREHARERMGKAMATQLGAEGISRFFGLGNLGRTMVGFGGELLKLTFSREDETEADIVGMELAARAGYDPGAGITLWQKMLAVSKGATLPFLSTHPAGNTRIKDIQGKLAKVQPIYERAPRPERRYAPPPAA